MSEIPHRRCGWIEVGGPGTESFGQNGGYFNVIHPVFWDLSLSGNNSTVVRTRINADQIFQTANESGTRVWPMIAWPQNNNEAHTLATNLHNPAWQNQHIQDILNLVLNDVRGYVVGVDLDYEHLASVNDVQAAANDFRTFLSDLTMQAHTMNLMFCL
jgi:hypothetical protein